MRGLGFKGFRVLGFKGFRARETRPYQELLAPNKPLLLRPNNCLISPMHLLTVTFTRCKSIWGLKRGGTPRASMGYMPGVYKKLHNDIQRS